MKSDKQIRKESVERAYLYLEEKRKQEQSENRTLMLIVSLALIGCLFCLGILIGINL